MKSIKCLIISTIACLTLSMTAQAELILWDNSGSPSTGDNLDEAIASPTPIVVEELLGLTMTITAVTGAPSSDINTTATSLGINGTGDADSDAFESAFNESFTFNFNLDVSITRIDFTTFDAGEVFSFGGTTINFVDLSNQTSDFYDFGTPLNIAASTPITVSATSGTIGIEGLTLTATAVPEPSTAILALLGGALLFARRKRA